jgi:glycosyltransferase involved in cell wall biosynthesis
MRILLVVVYYPPMPQASGQIIHDLAVEMRRRGHEVMVATPSDSVKEKTSVNVEDGVTVIRIRAAGMKSANKLVRLWREARLSANMMRRGRDVFKKHPCDLIVYYSPTIFFGELVHDLKRMWGCKSYLMHRDIFPHWAVAAGIIRDNGFLHRYLRKKELEQYAAADVIGVETRGNLPYFESGKQGSHFKLEVLYNWISESGELGPSRWRHKLGLENRVVFFYGGNIGVAQDLDHIVHLAGRMQTRGDVSFLLMGEGSEVARLNREIARLGLENIRIVPPLPRNEYMSCLAEFDVGLISLNRNHRWNPFPGKLLGYCAYGKPVLASVNPGHDLIELLGRSEAGIACVTGELDCLERAAILLASDSDLRARMGKNSRALAASVFSVETGASRILAHFSTNAVHEEPQLEAVVHQDRQ